MADYSAPKPVDPIWYQPSAWITIRCRCGRNVSQRLAHFATERGLDNRLLLHKLIARLRCSSCGKRPTVAEVTRYQRGNR